MKAFFSDIFDFPLPKGHRFPMRKYSLLRQRVLETHLISKDDLQVPEAASDEQILRVHGRDYLQRVKAGLLTAREVRRLGFPWSPQLVERSRRSVGGTIAACRAALREGTAANLAGGTHHAHPDFGSGFCLFNDAAVAARDMQAQDRIRRILIIDCDVHQGDGTAAIFAQDPTVYTFSIHGERNFPFHKQQSDLDVALPDGTGDEDYLDVLHQGLQRALQEANAHLAIYLAGADPFHGDTFGRMALTKSGLAGRDHLVLQTCRAEGLPVAVVMSGGYARRIEDIVDIHFATLQIAAQFSRAAIHDT